MQPPTLHTRREAAALLRVSVATIDRLRAAGEIPFVRPSSGSVRFSDADLARFVQARTVPAGRRDR